MENKLYEIEISFPDIVRKIVAPSVEEARNEIINNIDVRNAIDDWVLGEAKDVSDKYEFADAKFGTYGENEFAKKKPVLKVFEVRVDVMPCYINVIAESEKDAEDFIYENSSDLSDRIDTSNFEIDRVECTSTDASGYERGFLSRF